MSQYITRVVPVYAGNAASAITVGTVVKPALTGSVQPVTATTDITGSLGVALASADVSTTVPVALRSSGVTVQGQIANKVKFGDLLWVNSSAQLCSTASVLSGSNASDDPFAQALADGNGGDLIDVALR